MALSSTPVERSEKPLVVSCRPNGKPFMAKWQTFLTKHMSRIGASHATGSNRRLSHVHSYFTQLRAFMYVFRPVSASALPAATSAHPQHGRCASVLRGRQEVSRFAAPVCRRTRCVQY